jgi:ABC-type multidrug transport system ATPase subunit
MIQVHQLTHHYGIRPVLVDVSLEIGTGELVVLLGPNGSGKTTLLGCMAGTIWPARGHVEFDGVKRRESVDSERELCKRIVYLGPSLEEWRQTGHHRITAGSSDRRTYEPLTNR